MFVRSIAAAVALWSVVQFGAEARAAELIVLSNEGKTLSLVDTIKAKVVRSTVLKAGARLTTVSVNSVEREIWALSNDKRLIIFDYETFSEKSRSGPLDIEIYDGRLIYCTNESVYCNLVVSRKSVAALNDDGVVLQTADLPKASYRGGRPLLIGFGSVSDPQNTTSSKVFAIDGDQNALIRLPPNAPNPKWKLVAKLDRAVNAPLAFDTVREDGATRGYAILGATIYTLNLKSGRLGKPRSIRGLKGDAQSMSFYADPAAD